MDARARLYRAYPFLADWLQFRRSDVNRGGAGRSAREFLQPGCRPDGRINPNGHCDFTDGQHLDVGRLRR